MKTILLLAGCLVSLTACKDRTDNSALFDGIYENYDDIAGINRTPAEQLAVEKELLKDLQGIDDILHISLYGNLNTRPNDKLSPCGHEKDLAEADVKKILSLINEPGIEDTALGTNKDQKPYRNTPRYRMREELELSFKEIETLRYAFKEIDVNTAWKALKDSWTGNSWVTKNLWFLMSARAIVHTAYGRKRLDGEKVSPMRIQDLLFMNPAQFYDEKLVDGEKRLVIKDSITNTTKAKDSQIRHSIPHEWWDVDVPQNGKPKLIWAGDMPVLYGHTPAFAESSHFAKWFTCPQERYGKILKSITDAKINLPNMDKFSKTVTRSSMAYSSYPAYNSYNQQRTWTEVIKVDRLACGSALQNNMKLALEVAEYLESNWRYIFYALDNYQLTAREKKWPLPEYAGTVGYCAGEVGQSRILTKKTIKLSVRDQIQETKKRIKALTSSIANDANIVLSDEDWINFAPRLNCPEKYEEIYSLSQNPYWAMDEREALATKGKSGVSLYWIIKNPLQESRLLAMMDSSKTAAQNRDAIIKAQLVKYQGKLAAGRQTIKDYPYFKYADFEAKKYYSTGTFLKSLLLVCAKTE